MTKHIRASNPSCNKRQTPTLQCLETTNVHFSITSWPLPIAGHWYWWLLVARPSWNTGTASASGQESDRGIAVPKSFSQASCDKNKSHDPNLTAGRAEAHRGTHGCWVSTTVLLHSRAHALTLFTLRSYTSSFSPKPQVEPSQLTLSFADLHCRCSTVSPTCLYSTLLLFHFALLSPSPSVPLSSASRGLFSVQPHSKY